MIYVIIPVYNVEPYIDDCLKSIIAQDYKDVEFILVDDGSTDRSGEICDAYAKKDTRLKVYHIENGGVSKARNFGINKIGHSHSVDIQLITFIDPDDFLTSTTMYSELAEAWNDSLELLLFGFQISDENLNNVSPQPFPQSLPSELNTVDEISKEIYPSLMFGKKICNHSVSASLFRAVFDYKIIDKYSLRFRTDIRKAEDWCFFSDYLLHTSHIKLVDKVFYNYRVRRNSSITTYREPSALGLEKGLSILDYIKRNALQQPGLDLDVVNEYFNGRYNTLVLNYVKGLADKRSGFSLCTIYNKIDDIYQSESLRLQLSKNKTKFHISLHYLESLIVKRKLKGLMIAYTKAFYILKFIKNKAKS